MKATIWSKQQCPNCINAKNLLKSKGIEFEERMIDNGPWTKDDLLRLVPDARSVPQIFMEEEYIGGFNELQEYLKNNEI